MEATEQNRAYRSVNGEWPVGTNDGRNLKPTPQEALAGAKRLYRVAFGRPFRGKMKLTSGRRITWIRSGVFYVNPDEGGGGPTTLFINGVPQPPGGGWHEIVHSISHYAANRLHPNASGHSMQHAFIERTLIKHVVESGWLEGKLRREPKQKPPVDLKRQRHERVLAKIKAWQTKQKRARTALRKLERQRRYYERALAA